MSLKKYVGIDVIEARPMAKDVFYMSRGWGAFDDGGGNPFEPGYMIIHETKGFTYWMPKKEFEKKYKELDALIKED